MSRYRLAALALVGVSLAGPALARAQQPGGMMRMRGMTGMGHDSATMAMMAGVHELVVNHDRITRTVTNLPNGVRTVTESDDPRLAAIIREHVGVTVQRVEKGDDPALPMETPALRAIFRAKDKIHTTTDTTAKGIVLVQTSNDSAAVAALQQHASEVSDLVNRGMTAMHEAMMKNGFMRGAPPGPPRRE